MTINPVLYPLHDPVSCSAVSEASLTAAVGHVHTCRKFPRHKGAHRCPACSSRWDDDPTAGNLAVLA